MRRGFLAPATALLAVAFCGLVSCSWRSVSKAMPWSGTPKVALVLTGGVARGFAHVGVIRVLERQKIPIDIIVGADTGSLIGAIYADRKSASELERIALALEEGDIFDYSFINPTQGFARGERLEDFLVQRLTARDIERLRMPFAAVATDLATGASVALTSGSLARAVHASIAIPGIFAPVAHEGKLLTDGSVLDNVPIGVARKLGADVVIAVDLTDGMPAAQSKNTFETLLQGLFLATRQSSALELRQADFVIRPKLGSAGLMDFTRKKELVALGMTATEEALPAIRNKIGMK
ncbi:MAG TPA: patatin-like phospholipase family protein [Candidatus Binatia bacterium]|nr:patatin-like phospholipase family protein [Candidatus Binatia bacterium]